MRKQTGAILALGLLSCTAWAQSGGADKPPLYTYVSQWAVPRVLWADYLKIQANDDKELSKAVADGTIVGFGSFSVLNHQDGAPTHGTWFSATSMANLMKVLEAERAAPDNTAGALAASKHWDLILQSRNYGGHSGSFKNGYLRVGTWRYKAGASDPDGKILKATMVAMFDKLLQDGALHSYQIDEEAIHSADPDAFYLAIVANGGEGLDKFNAAIESLGKDNPMGEAAFGSLVDLKGHRDFLAHVDAMSRQ